MNAKSKKTAAPTVKKAGADKNAKSSGVKKTANGNKRKITPKKSKKMRFKVKAVLALALCAVFILSAGAVYLCFFIPRGFLNMGMNIGGSGYYFNRTLMFNDVFKTSSNLKTMSGWHDNLNVELSEDGYPVGYNNNEYEKKVIFLINNIYTGDYIFLYDGDGDFDFTGGAEVLSKEAGAIHLRFTEPDINAAGGGQRFVTIQRSDYTNRVRNIRIIPAEYFGKENKMPTFRKDFLRGLKDMHTLRFMDAVKTNGSKQQHWESRAKVDDFTYEPYGLPYEYLIELCNTLKVDGWFSVPHMATDDYIENLAKLIKSNLNKNRKAYIEYSNEVWNRGFEQALYVVNNADGAVDAYVPQELAKLGAPDERLNVKAAFMMMRTFRIFEGVFSGKDRKRIITVGAIHTAAWIESTKETIRYWESNDALPDAIAGTAYIGYETSFWNDAAIPKDVLPRANADELNNYFHNKWNASPKTVTADDIINAVYTLWDYTIEPTVRASVEAIKASGAMYFVYEGGQHMQPHNQGVWEYNQAVYDCQISPRMYELYMKNFKLHAELECEMFMNFSFVSARESQWGSWGVLENTSDVYAKNLKKTAPKYKALVDANKRKGLV